LASVLYKYGELKDSRRMAAEIIKRRSDLKFDTISSLVDALKPFLLRDREKKELAKVFQALRIEVNSELVALEEMLYQSLDLLKPGGRLVVMTYHSLEDRIVKNFLKTGNFEGKSNQDFYGNFLTPFKLINNKVIVPGDDEQSQNPRSRSAKLRIAEKK
jgi:16S rRNA (cytosine1402-N4)-methyltransferase